MTKYKSDTKRPHFKHHYLFRHESRKYISYESGWHKKWRSHFDQKEVSSKTDSTRKYHYADAIIHNMIIEFRHSEISYNDVTERCKIYQSDGYDVTWIIDCTDDTVSLVDLHNGCYLLKFLNNDWKYRSFVYCNYIYLDCRFNIIRINPKDVTNNMIYVNEYKSKSEFINALKNNNLVWQNDTSLPTCNIYFNQRGAGCGKTYESIQLLDVANGKFSDKNTFIYLTKMHSAKEVIYNEFKEQYDNGHLSNLKCDRTDDHLKGKQYKISYRNSNGTRCKVIIATIDAFMVRIGTKLEGEMDYFHGIVKSIREKMNKHTDELTLGNTKLKLCRETMVIIDEAQDLSPDYVQAVATIMGSTHFDTYIIGDKLQSIWGEDNVFTFLEKNEFPHPVKIIRTIGENKVRRFHNERFIELVNGIIDFEKYSLPKITSICDGICRYNHKHDSIPYEVFRMETLRHNKIDKEMELKTLTTMVSNIIARLDREVDMNGYLPNNFLFIFPFLKKNRVASKLESGLQEYWKSKFENEHYNRNFVQKNEYWTKTWDKNKYIQYVFLHKSDEGKSINLRESEHATRIMSIHASKGTGCEVVFLLDLNERSLRLYTETTGTLTYDSLLHVAITRQKMKLYVGIASSSCDIYRRFNKQTNIQFDDKEPQLSIINPNINFEKLSSYNFLDEFTALDKIFGIINKNNIDEKTKRDIVDWGHHTVRNAVFKYKFLMCIYNNETNNDYGDQFRAVIMNIMNRKVETILHHEYYKRVKQINDWWKNGADSKCRHYIPILYFGSTETTKYSIYKNAIVSIVVNIQKKLLNVVRMAKLPDLCPLESIVLWHVIELCQNGVYANTTIMDVYNIIYYYDNTFSEADNINHKKYKCMCFQVFTAKGTCQNVTHSNIQVSIKNHHEKLHDIHNMYVQYREHVNDTYREKFRYNILLYAGLQTATNREKFWRIHWLIANSNSYVINFVFRPQLNKINFNEMFVGLIHDQYLLSNSYGKNIARFHNKKIIHCVLSLNLDPVFYDINVEFNSNLSMISSVIRNSIKKYYMSYNKLLFEYFNYKLKHVSANYKNSIIYIHDEIKKYAGRLPQYINDFIQSMTSSMDETSFIQEDIFNKKMKTAISEFVDRTISR